MSNQVKTLNELKDSRILYDKNVPGFAYMIIIIVMALIITIIIWSILTPKIDIIKAPGMVQSINKNYVMVPYSGKIVDINIEEGTYVEKGNVLLTIKSTEFDLQAKQLDGKKELCMEKIRQLKKLAASIKDDINYFNEGDEKDNLYYYQFENYKSQIAQQKFDAEMYKSYGYTDAQIENEIEKNQNKITEIYYSTLKSIEDSIQQYENELINIELQLEAVGSGQEEYQVEANATGKIHMLAEYKEGMVVQAGSAIANIASEQDEYKIQAYVDANSIARISVGDKVNIAVSGLAETVYGTITGQVVRKDSDITADSEKGTSYFKVDIIPDNTYIISKKGYKVNFSNGMPVEARIQYDQVSYFDYVLESLGILTR
ncbi:HlyD family secretion protein [Acetivibrio clariflavus]|uniref:HlyD family secretion protein n=1 Tax=Acetivibrio clariflavus TaxID=288965 RepID=UPI0004855EF2|nr:HlyD family efflux transporter periplasmic adaptor subunit [Acetivibrio clariflavus]